ncbi:anti-sigma regulatory factor (Ser/Thr protein kinase) [Rubidibacter lacunae KORDI 51-2]|uniref:Anti-sigma regulatory factor (Ser/Thr protein kinase) n=1 Tax=Rubidibacter lacunae KORDI 51-2 TaxID=582515 RepID=U5DIC7_9CHRO|nr:anti-sigma regulatory factor [Rubidibacter lacunae]ERN40687.1 anti-sigma regulatory factor (Ser/Thr protein kinase) [Rubidibacter lacunae KORDI 51-2]
MIAVSLRPTRCNWGTLSFASTLYLCPILDLLLAKVPEEDRPEVRLGLQEALVNAAKHGNNLDPTKTIVVHYSYEERQYTWVISDNGSGFDPQRTCEYPEDLLPSEFLDRGRGTCILHKVFDRVHWNCEGTQLVLSRYITKPRWFPFWSS